MNDDDEEQVDFVLEGIDTATECVEIDVVLHIDNVEELRCLPGMDTSEFDPERYAVRIRPSSRVDSLPYKVHTNRELSLMLKGSKPLAVCFDVCPGGSEVPEERLFEPYVAAGRFVERVQRGVRIKGSNAELCRVFFAQPGEEWRIDAYLLMNKVAEHSGWNESLERMEGSLLGYEDWQNDVFIETFFRTKPKG